MEKEVDVFCLLMRVVRYEDAISRRVCIPPVGVCFAMNRVSEATSVWESLRGYQIVTRRQQYLTYEF